ncbi:Indoleamine 2,3-dioxygenase 2 [Apodemus speciosus]|uniref:Indoleamine 2,3-dioxygenase 2 n=1 Tax=Apodemus speciosus TaxID=105296 RepID=A0ABQ0F180_APOSI
MWVELPDAYSPWTLVARNLPKLIENGQLREEVEKLPTLCTDELRGHRLQRLAHLALGYITMAYVWNRGDDDIRKAIPTVSSAVEHQDLTALEKALCDIAASLERAKDIFKRMRDFVDPDTWKGNPKLPEGLLYEGVWDTPKKFSGGSAGQSSIFQSLDILLGIKHDTGKNNRFVAILEFNLGARFSPPAEAPHNYQPPQKTQLGSSLNLAIPPMQRPQSENMEPQSQSVQLVMPLSLGRYHISEECGFLLPNPLEGLPDYYKPWMEIANRLPHLIESHQLQARVYKMPLLDCTFLKSYGEQRLAHLALAAITMGFVWQEGEDQPGKNYNATRPWDISNLETIISFPGGESLRGFILVTVLVEKAAVPGIKALVQGVEAIRQHSQDTLLEALQQLRLSIQDMTRALAQMHAMVTKTKTTYKNYVDPDIFYAVIRIFLSGWKDNPAMPAGLVYEGVSAEPLKYTGGSAAQSSVLHAFDEFLGIQHCAECVGFLHRMRDYMPPSHKAFLEDLHSAPSLRDYILTSGPGGCLTAYNQCVEALVELRSYHISVVARYIISTAAKARSAMLTRLSPDTSEDRGTGGTAVLSFLKSVRDKTVEALLCPGP